MRKKFSFVTTLIILGIFLIPILPLFSNQTSFLQNSIYFSLENTPRPLFQDFNATLSFQDRQAFYLNLSKTSDGLDGQTVKIYLNLSVNEATINATLNQINLRKDTADFGMNAILRMLYYDNITHDLNNSLYSAIKNAVLNFKYWFTEPNNFDMIMWTENHMILFHTAELLAGQLFRNETFPNSNMTGEDHINHAAPLVQQWLTWRGQFGFSEWHSDIYLSLDLKALFNLIEFAEDPAISTKAAMLVDLIGFDFANNYYKSIYATTHGRTEDNKKVGNSVDHPASWESTSQFAWLMLGLGSCNLNDPGNSGCISLALSEKYTPPPILEDIAQTAQNSNEHKERSSINMDEGPQYGIGYTSEDDLMFWWPLSSPTYTKIAEPSLALVEKYNIKPKLVYNDALFVDLLKLGASLYGTSFGGFCDKINIITRGACLESVNTYTYRTPYYQLSGAQDHQKGLAGLQEHIWQASLDENAIVYTSSPGGVSDQEFTGGWKPRATFYKNVGIIQYDRTAQSLLLELVLLYLNYKPYTHAYFPQWAFDEVVQQGKWTFGQRGDSYVALYSFESTRWMSNYELRSQGKKNAFIVELGSVADYGTFENFTTSISTTSVKIKQLDLGFQISYLSPTLGEVTVSWEGDMHVNGHIIDLGPYPRFQDAFCTQSFGTNRTEITFGTQSLILDFDAVTRVYSTV